jgi:hypothetical protein
MTTTMKASALVPFTILALAAAAFAQGPLTPPPGAPAPLMKSLDQIEARTPLVAGQPGVSIDANGGITISASGSYYLTGNRTVSTGNGILINSSGVSVDLNGFSLTSTSPTNSGVGIAIGSSIKDITISNGHIRGSVSNSGGTYTGNGFNDGINAPGGAVLNAQVRNVTVSGCKAKGIDLAALSGISTVVESCVVRSIGGLGIAANVVSHCSATDCGSIAISADVVSNCTAKSTTGVGINADVVQNCHAVGAVKGILAEISVTNSYGEGAASDPGISCPSGTTSFSQGKSDKGFAIYSSITIGCTTAGGPISSAQKHLGTP